MRRLTSTRFPAWTVLIAAAAAGILCYGLLIPRLGFYWDDMAYQYSLHVFGPAGFKAFVAGDRPFSSYFYIVTSTLFNAQPALYQTFNLLLRLATACASWWMLTVLWPGRGTSLAWVPLAFMVYPGFLQQPIPFIYNLHWINYLQSVLSLAFMLLAVRAWLEGRTRRFWLFTGLAMLLSLNIFSLEYSFGLELLRPLLIFLVLSEHSDPRKKRVTATFKLWLPYLAVLVAFLVWTLVINHNALYTPTALSDLARSPVQQSLGLSQRILQDVSQTTLGAWLKLFNPLYAFKLSSSSDVLFWVIAVAAGLALLVYLLRLCPDPLDANPPRHDRWARQALLVGFWALLPAGIPFWMVGLNYGENFPFDRFSLPSILGISLLLAAALEVFIKTRPRRVIVFSVLMALSMAFQFQNTNTFRREWSNLDTFVWQMTWRAPGIQPGTMLMTHGLPFTYYSDNSLSGVINMTYAPEKKNSRAMDYMLVYLYDRLNGSLSSLAPNTRFVRAYRSLKFTGNTSQALVLYYSPPGCLRLLDPQRPQELPDVPQIYRDVLPLSKLERVQPAPANPVQPVPGWFPQPGESWCKAYEQADLARQQGNWSEARRLGDEALARGQFPADPTELGVLIEARARLKDLDSAAELTRQAIDSGTAGQAFACGEWDYLAQQGLAAPDERAARFPALKCLAPAK